MLSAVIIDDEALGRQSLRQKLTEFCPDIQILGEAIDGQSGREMIEASRPDIVFLDVEMPGLSGFDMLQELSVRDFHLVFTTAYDQYALRAIKYAAFDYLLKPIDVEELRTTVARIGKQHEVSHVGARLDVLLQNLSTRNQPRKIAIPTMEGLLFFDINDIVCLQADSNYTTLKFSNRHPVVVSKTLREFEDMLPHDMFFRPHNSWLINLDHIKRYIKGDGGQVEMSNGDFVDVSRRRKDEFLKLIR